MSSYREEEGIALLRLLYENPNVPVAMDTETNGLEVANSESWCIGASIACIIEGKAYKHYFAFAHELGENCSKRTRDMFGYVMLQPRLIIFANALFDILSVDTMHYRMDGVDFIDICTMAHLINENRPYNKGLESLSQYYLKEAGKLDTPEITLEKKTGWKNTTPEQMWDYAVMDAVTTYRVWDLLKDNKIWLALPEDLWPNKQKLIRVLIEMKRRGVLVDQELAAEQVAVGEAEMKRLAIELGYPAKPTKKDPDPLPTLGPIAMEDLFLNRLKLPVLKRGAKSKRNPEGNPGFDKAVMEQYDEMLELLDSTEAKLVKEYRGWQKAVSAAYRPYLRFVYSDGRLRCSYKTHGTVTGRLSCVSGDTLLQTTRGVFRFDEYQPEIGDQVLTHLGRLRPVVRKIYRGVCTAYRVVFSDGTEVTATEDHRFWTPTGWAYVRDLSIGNEVLGVHQQELASFGERSESHRNIHIEREAGYSRSSETDGHYRTQRTSSYPGRPLVGESPSGAAASILSVKDGSGQSYVGKGRGFTPQLHRGSVGWQGLSSGEDWDGVRFSTQAHHGTSFGPHVTSPQPRRASHRHESAEQRPKQLSFGHEVGAQKPSQKIRTIENISTVGEIPVWDIEVADDHSYLANGVFSHNCSEPNLQQIPKTSDKPWNGRVKECFIAKPGYVLLNADFSQLELRVGTAYAGELGLAKVFEEGRDIFTEMSERLGMKRQDTKTLVYSMQYGAGVNRIMGAFGVSNERATQIRKTYYANYPRFRAFSEMCSEKAKQEGRVKIWTGRYRHFMYPKEEYYKAMNSVIQGGAADVMERVMVKVFEEIHCDDCAMLMQVHDSITFEVREDLAEYYTQRIDEVMSDVTGAIGEDLFPVKFAVEVGPWVEPK